MGGQDGWTKHQSIVIAAVKILTVFAQIGTIVFPSAFLFGLGIPKALFILQYTKTLFFAIHTTPQTLYLPSPLRQNTFLAISAMP